MRPNAFSTYISENIEIRMPNKQAHEMRERDRKDELTDPDAPFVNETVPVPLGLIESAPSTLEWGHKSILAFEPDENKNNEG